LHSGAAGVRPVIDLDNFAICETFNATDQVGRLTVFDIGGNKYRMIGVIHFNRGKLFVRHVRTHKEYDEEKWKSG